MTVTVKHSKTNAITDWTQAQLDEQIALGNFAPGTTLANIVLPSDWNNNHTLTGVGTMAEQNASAVAITGGAIDGTTIGSTTASTGRFTSVTTPSVTATTTDLTLSAISTGVVNVNTLAGKAFSVTDHPFTAGGANVNFTRAFGGQTGYSTGIMAQGTDGTVVLAQSSKGATSVQFFTSSFGAQQFNISHTASAVNYVQVTGATTGNRPTITAQGSDANAGLSLFAKGTGGVFIGSNLGTTAAIVSTPTTGTNYFAVNGSATTIAPTISVAGGDTNIPLALQTKGTGAIDLAAGSSGVNISNGGTVTAITRTAAGSAYTTPPTVAISAPTTAGGVQATATVTIGLVSVTSVASGGTGYTVGDVLTVSGGTFTVACQVTVTAVSGGVITAASVTTGGSYTVAPTNPVSVTGGTGSSATFNLSFCIGSAFTITAAGSGYIEQPTVTFSGGGGSGAAAYATVGSNTTFRSIGSNLNLNTPSGTGFAVSDAGATSAQWWQAIGGAFTGILRSTGSTQNGLIQTSGTGGISLQTNNGAQTQFIAAHTASAVNYVQVTGSATGGLPTISAQGSDTNIPLAINSKGASAVRFAAQNADYPILNGGTGTVSLGVAGSSTNIDLAFNSKGTGAINVNTSGGTQFKVANTATAVNNLEVTGAIATAAPILRAIGTDTNIDLALTPKGTGRVRFGTYTGTILTPTGYVEIVDSGGTVRRLLVG